MRAPTQVERVLRALRHGPVTQLDFLSPTCDGGPPVLRLASRVSDLRERGHLITTTRAEWVGGARLARYRLIPAEPTAMATHTAPTAEQGTLDVGSAAAHRPASPYDLGIEGQ